MKNKLKKAPRLPKKDDFDCDGPLCNQIKSIGRRVEQEKEELKIEDIDDKAIKEVLKEEEKEEGY